MMTPETIQNERGIPVKTGPTRTCVGCGERGPAKDFVRVVIDFGGNSPGSDVPSLAVDLGDGRFGRGAHVHSRLECLERAKKAGFSKAFKMNVNVSLDDLRRQIVLSAARRLDGLLSGARRGRHVAVGADAVRDASAEGTVALFVVACDAAAAANLDEVRQGIDRGIAIVFGDKKHLGELFGRDEVGVCAVLHEGLALAVARTFRIAEPFLAWAAEHLQGASHGEPRSRSGAWWSREVR